MRVPIASVIIPTLNSQKTLQKQIISILNQDTSPFDFEVIIADNGSFDGTKELVANFANNDDRIKYVDASSKKGVSFARNAGVSVASGSLIIFCDADDVVKKGWLNAYINAFLERPGQTYGGQLARFRGNQFISTSGLNSTLWDLAFPSGANCAVDKSTFEKLGQFDESWEWGGEDANFFWNAQLHGVELIFVKDAWVVYQLRESIKSTIKQQFLYGLSGSRLYAKYKNKGMPAEKITKICRSMAIQILGLFRLNKHKRMFHMGRVAFQVGKSVGSYRYKVKYF